MRFPHLLVLFAAAAASDDNKGSLGASCGCEAAPPTKSSRIALVQEGSGTGLLPPRPNVVLLISDDVDREWLGAYRTLSERTKSGTPLPSVTPNLDQLARDGALFSRAYSAASTCAPSRYALLTGRWPSRAPSTATFVGDMVPNVKLPDDCEAHHSVNGTTIDPGETTLAHHLRSLGYHTSFVGKWHCSSEIAMMHSPLRDRRELYSWMQSQVTSRGFDEADGLYFTNVPQLRAKLGKDVNHHQEWLTQISVEYIRRRARHGQQVKQAAAATAISGTATFTREPFFLVMASTLPHGPDLHLWPKANETLRTVDGEAWGQEPAEKTSATRLETLRRRRREAHRKCVGKERSSDFQRLVKYRRPSVRWLVQYIPLKGNECAKLALFDDAVGEIVDALRETGQLKDTLLVYTTDHGWSDKGFAYEHAAHVPLIFHWPRLLPGGRLLLPQLVSTVDVAATAVEAASRGRLLGSFTRNQESTTFIDNRHDRDGLASVDGRSLLHLIAPTRQPSAGTAVAHSGLALPPEARSHRSFVFVENGWSRAVVSTVASAAGSDSHNGHHVGGKGDATIPPRTAGIDGGLKFVRNYFPRYLNRQWSREAGGVRINPYFGSGCVHDWWSTAVVKHGNFFDRNQFYDLESDGLEQRSLYRSLKPLTAKRDEPSSELERPVHPLTDALDEMADRLLEHTKRTKRCSEVCAVRIFDGVVLPPGATAESIARTKTGSRNQALYRAYISVLNSRNDSKNFLTNWFTWNERYRSPF